MVSLKKQAVREVTPQHLLSEEETVVKSAYELQEVEITREQSVETPILNVASKRVTDYKQRCLKLSRCVSWLVVVCCVFATVLCYAVYFDCHLVLLYILAQVCSMMAMGASIFAYGVTVGICCWDEAKDRWRWFWQD